MALQMGKWSYFTPDNCSHNDPTYNQWRWPPSRSTSQGTRKHIAPGEVRKIILKRPFKGDMRSFPVEGNCLISFVEGFWGSKFEPLTRELLQRVSGLSHSNHKSAIRPSKGMVSIFVWDTSNHQFLFQRNRTFEAPRRQPSCAPVGRVYTPLFVGKDWDGRKSGLPKIMPTKGIQEQK